MVTIVSFIKSNKLNEIKILITSILHHSRKDIKFNLVCSNKYYTECSNYFKKQKINNITLKVHENPNVDKINNIFPELDKIIFIESNMLILDDISILWESFSLEQNINTAYLQNWFYLRKDIFIRNLKFENNKNIYYKIDSKWNSKLINTKNYFFNYDKLSKYYLNDVNNCIYLLYYDNNPSNGRAKIFLDSVNRIKSNIVPHNVHKYEKFITVDNSLGINIKRHFCIKYFIENNNINSYYLSCDAYDVFFINFDYRIIDYMEKNNLKVLYQTKEEVRFSKLFCKTESYNDSVNLFKNNLFNCSYGINGGSFFGKGYNIVNLYNNIFKYILKYDESDERLLIRTPVISSLINLDPIKYFINYKSICFKNNDFNINDFVNTLKINDNTILFHFPGTYGKVLYNKLEHFDVDNINKIYTSDYYQFCIRTFRIRVGLFLLKIRNILINYIIKFIEFILSYIR